MKRIFTLFVAALAFAACGTFDDSEIWDRLDEYGEAIKDHENRIASLEELCKQLNTNIDALQTLIEALEKRDYITNVAPVTKDGSVIGYTISFANSETITIYHGEAGTDGENGTDGKDGADGNAPQIGVGKDSDGIYYWTINGEWLLDSEGAKIPATGKDGEDGNDGENGITPKLKIESGFWYASFDNGATWEKLAEAEVVDCKGGDNIFESVTMDDEYVYFRLTDGTTIAIPLGNSSDSEYIDFLDNTVELLCISNWDLNGDDKLSYSEAAAVKSLGNVFTESDIISLNELRYFTGLTSIEEACFYSCELLNRIIIPNNIITIGADAFRDCSSLTSITIPDSVTMIGANAFEYCDNLTSITIPDSVTTIEGYAFNGCYSLTSITIPDSVTMIGANAFEYCDNLTSITIPDSVTTIEGYAFNGCYSLTSAAIGNSVTTIGKCAFRDCSSLTSITIPDSVTMIGWSAFENCESLTSITIPDSVTTIEGYAFNGCYSLTSAAIGNSVTTIGGYAFYHCDNLTSITIPDSVTTIGAGAFLYCYSLKNFSGRFTSEDAKLLIADGVVLACAPAGLTSYAIPNGVTTINNEVFYDCDSLTSVTIPDTVTTIGNEAFYSCDNLTSVTIGKGIESIGEKAFWGCDNIAELYCLATVPPAIYYYYEGSSTRASISFGSSIYGSFPINLTLWIYVPYEAYDNYTQYSEIDNNNISQSNWKVYIDYLIPYDFEKGEVVEINREPCSRLTEDYTFSYGNWTMRLFCYGDYYNIGSTRWRVDLFNGPEPLNGNYFIIELIADNLLTEPEGIIGTYSAASYYDSKTPATFISGYDKYYYSWYCVVGDGIVLDDKGAPISEGTITISDDYSVTLDCEDDMGHKIQGVVHCKTLNLYYQDSSGTR